MAKDKSKARTSVNPFQKLQTEAEIISAAKSGAMVSGYLGLSYSLQAGMLYWSGRDLFGNGGMALLAGDIVAIAFAALLTWRILQRQPLWAAVVAAIWYFAELAGKFAGVGSSSSQANVNVGFIIMFAALGSAAILGIRGALKRRQGGAVAEVFE